MLYNLNDSLSQPDANQPVARYVWRMTISVEGHTFVVRVCRRCTEVGRGCVTAPSITLLVTAARVTRNEEASVEGRVTDQQLIRVSVVCIHAVPQSVSASSIPIVVSGRYRHLVTSFEGYFLSSLMINEHYFRELQDKSEYVCIKIIFVEKILGRFLFVECSFFVTCIFDWSS